MSQNRLRQEGTRHEESLVLAQSRIAFLESETYLSEVIEEYRWGIVGKAEVALACKARYDYLEKQLPAETRSTPSHFHYPPNVANCVEALEVIERLGGGLDLDTVDAEDGEDDDEDEATEAPAERIEEGIEDSSGRRDEGAESGSQTTPPPTPTSALPLTPRVGMDLSPSP